MSAPLFLNIQPQSGSASSKGSLPSLKGKQGKQKGSAKGKASAKAPPFATDSTYLKYTIQEVSLCHDSHDWLHLP